MAYTINEMKIRSMQMDHHFFDPDSMRFFDSRICTGADDNGLFVTSERFDRTSPRLYTIRRFIYETGAVETVGEFQQYATLAEAKRHVLR